MSMLRRAGPAAVIGPVVVTGDDGAGLDGAVLAALAELARGVLEREGVTGPSELTLTVVDEPTIADLNAEWMGEDGVTDVLSWPLDAGETPAPGGPPVLLGDVVLCPAVAERYATGNGRSTADELALLVVHGVLHVLGWDHAAEDEAAAMRQREHDHLTNLYDPRWTHSPS